LLSELTSHPRHLAFASQQASTPHALLEYASPPGVRELVENVWVNLFAIFESGKNFSRYGGKQFLKQIEQQLL
jgi:hypothetical protein